MDFITFLEIYFGTLLMLTALAIVINRYAWEQILGDIESNHLVMLIAGTFALFIGLLTVSTVGFKEMGPHIILPILGWLSIVKGVMIFLTPNWLIRIAHGVLNSRQMHAIALLSFTLGAILLVIAITSGTINLP